MIDPATASSSTRETLEFRFAGALEVRSSRAPVEAFVLGELPFPSAGANGSQRESADASRWAENAPTKLGFFHTELGGTELTAFWSKAGAGNRASGESWHPWHSARASAPAL